MLAGTESVFIIAPVARRPWFAFLITDSRGKGPSLIQTSKGLEFIVGSGWENFKL